MRQPRAAIVTTVRPFRHMMLPYAFSPPDIIAAADAFDMMMIISLRLAATLLADFRHYFARFDVAIDTLLHYCRC